MAIRAVVGNSISETFDEARIEWELEAVLADDSEGFSNICELCGNPSLKNDFIIYNPTTGKRLTVGSRCIIRFGIIKGNVDVESGHLLINNFITMQQQYFQVRSLVKGMMVLNPDAKEYQLFYLGLKKILESKGLKEPTVDELGEICYGDKWKEYKDDRYKCERLKLLWYKPLLINTVKTKVAKDKKYKEGTTFGHKSRTSVYIPGAARSEAFKTDKISD
jgi:hypothetical protein